MRKFPVQTGMNQIRIIITDPFGKKETIDYSPIVEPELLDVNAHRFFYAAGSPYEDEGAKRNYDSENAEFSFIHKKGIYNDWTVGLFAQGNKKSRLYGFDSANAFFQGLLGVSVAEIQNENTEDLIRGQKVVLTYRSSHDKGETSSSPSWAWMNEYISPRFHFFGTDLNQPNLYNYTTSLSLSIPIFFRSSIGTVFKRFISSDPDQFQNAASLQFSKSWQNGIQISMSVGETSGHQTFEQTANFSLNWTLQEDQSFQYTNDMKTGDTDMNWQYASQGAVDSGSMSISGNQSKDTQTIQIASEYTGRSGQIGIDHDYSRDRDTQQDQGSSSRIFFRSSVQYVGGYFSISPPVSDSFAIAYLPEKAKEGTHIPINRVDDSYEGVLTRSRATVNTLRSYHFNSVHFDSSYLPTGSYIENENISVRPTHKSGVLVPVKVVSHVTVIGTLVDHNGKPVSLVSGEIRAPGYGTTKAFFTNRRGRFSIQGVEDGKYRIFIHGLKIRKKIISIKKVKGGFLRLGKIKIVPKS